MTVEKSFGFGNQSPYTSFTFNRNNDLIFAKNGPLSIGSITNDLPNVILENITFVQQGVIVKKTGSVSVPFPTNLPVPFYLAASVPDTNNVDNIIYSFVRRPQDIGENTALIAEWDGQEWRHLDRLSLKEFIDEREKRARAYDNLGFNNGFRFSPNEDFTQYKLTKGQVTDKTGFLVTKEEDVIFDAIEADADFDRIDAILWRRLDDDRNRIGFPILRPGNTYSGSSISQINKTLISGTSEVNSKPKIIVLDDNTHVMFYVEQYGTNGELKAVKYDEDRSTELVSPTVITNGVLDYDVSLAPNGELNVVFIKDNDLSRMKVASTDLSTITPPAAIDGLDNPVSAPVIETDFLGNQHIMFLYQLSPTIFSPYYMKLNLGGTVSKSPIRLRFNSDNYSKVDFKVNDDLELFVAYSNESKGSITHQKLDEVGEQLTEVSTVSDDTFDGSSVLTGDARNAQIYVSENNIPYITWEQDKGAGVFGLVVYEPKLIERTTHKAAVLVLDNPSENVLDHKMTVDWQNHGHILFNDGSSLKYYKYFLPALNSRLEDVFEVDTATSLNFDIAYDKKGSLVTAFARLQSGTTSNLPLLTAWKTGSGTFGTESLFLASNEMAVRDSALAALSPKPTIGDSVSISGSGVGNDGTYLITNEKSETINGVSHTVYTMNTAFAASENETGTQAIFTELDGNNLYTAKQSSAIAYSFSEMRAEELESDLFAVLIRKSDNQFSAWYDLTNIPTGSPLGKIETILTNGGNLNWNAGLAGGTLSWDAPFRVIDPFRGSFEIEDGDIDGVSEDTALYVRLPKTQFLIADGDTNTVQVTDVSEFEVGKKAFISDSDSPGQLATVLTIGLGEIELDITVNQYTQVRGAYIVPAELTLNKEQQNSGDLKPNSLGEIDADIYIIAYRKDGFIYFRDGGVTLEDGETGQIGDGTSSETLNFIGAANEADANPVYTEALGLPAIPNTHVVDNESLFKSVKRLDIRQDILPQVDLIDLVRTTRPTTTPAEIDGVSITDGTVVFFPYAGEKVYKASISGTTITWEEQAPFGGGVIAPQDGFTLKVTNGNTDYLKTIWERTSGLWRPVQVKDATDEPSGFKYEDLDQSEITFDNNTRTLTIAPTGDFFDYFIQGRVYRKTTPQSIQIPDIEGQHFVYFDGENLQTVATFDIDLILRAAYVSNLYWDKDNQEAILVAEERHGITMDGATHRYLHNTRGTRLKEGFAIGTFELAGDGDEEDDAQISLGDGILYDEDLRLVISDTPTPTERFEQVLSPAARLPVYYRVGSSGNWRRDDATDFPLKQGTSRIQYNPNLYSVWQTTEVPSDGQYASMWIFATNNIDEPVIAIMGQRVYDSLSEAQEEETFASLSTGNLPFVEFKLLFRLIYETDSSYTNTPKAALRDVQDLRAGADTPFPSVSPSDHGLLSGLDDPDHGPTAVSTRGVVKDGGLSEADEDAFDVFDTFNKLFGQLRLKEHPTNKKRVVVTGAQRILNSGVTLVQELRNLILEFDGAEVDLETGVIYESDGVTTLGDPFTPASIPAGEYWNYSITLLPNNANETLNTITGQLIVLPAPAGGASPATAPRPPFANGIKLGYVTVQENAGSISNISEDDIHQLGTGGGGGGGTGDANELEGRIQNRLNLTDFQYGAVNIFGKTAEELIDDTSTAEFSVVNSTYEFSNPGDELLTIDMFGEGYLANFEEITEVEISKYVDLEDDKIGEDATVEVSRDGGNSWTEVTMSRVGVSDTFRGLAKIEEEPDTLNQSIGGTTSSSSELDDTNYLSEPFSFTMKSTIRMIDVDVQKAGNPLGFIYAEIRKDNAGSPDLTVDGFVGRSGFISVVDLTTGSLTFSIRSALPAGDYHLLIKSDDLYKASYTVSDRVLVENDGSGIVAALNGYEHDLRVRVTRGADELVMAGIGILYNYTKGTVLSQGDVKRDFFRFNGSVDNLNEFELSFTPDPRLLMIFEIGTGQVFRYGLDGFLLEGRKVVFEANTFNKPEDVTLEAIQFMGSVVANDDDIMNTLATNHIGDPNGVSNNFLTPGRGLYLMRPDGTVRELTIDDDDNIAIYSI